MALNNLKAGLANMIKVLDPNIIASDFKEIAVPNTPIKTGNARKSTTVQGSQIIFDYPYFVSLEQGGSKQAPFGILNPTVRAVQELTRKKLGL